jgi:hypothetical protein
MFFFDGHAKDLCLSDDRNKKSFTDLTWENTIQQSKPPGYKTGWQIALRFGKIMPSSASTGQVESSKREGFTPPQGGAIRRV